MNSKEIAKLAGVSRSTVSRVVNHYPNVPPETREKVMKVIEEYHYEPDISGRVLAGKGTKTIGLFLISMTDQDNPNRIYQNNYFAPFVDAVVDCANKSDYYVLVHTVYKEEDLSKVKQAFVQRRVDAGVIIGLGKNDDFLKDLSQFKSPIAVIDYETGNHIDHIVTINATDYAGAIDAMQYMLKLGHREIGIIKGTVDTFSGRERYRAYVDVMEKNGLTIHTSYVLEGQFIQKKAYQQVKKTLQTKRFPTAFFCCNDDMALAAMEAIKEEGFEVPRDISIIGVDDVPIASQITPALTTVKTPVLALASQAVESLIGRLHQVKGALTNYSIPTQLIVRESCKEI